MNGIAPVATAMRFMLIIKSGPDKGAFQLLPPKATLGRSPENDVNLNDPRCSRQHAVIEFRHQKIVILDVSGRNATLVNGEPQQESELKDGDVIQLGDTKLQFRIDRPHAAPPQAAHPQAQTPMASPQRSPAIPPGFQAPQGQMPFPPPQTHAPHQAHGHAPGHAPRHRPPRPKADNSKRVRFYIIVAVVLGIMVWLLNSETPKPVDEPRIRSDADIEKDLADSQARLEQLNQKRQFANDEERTRYEEAQMHYIQGFRDYQKGLYSRAIKSFETAKAIDPKFDMAVRYHSLAEKKRDELVMHHMIEATKYKERNMFNRCVSSSSKVLDLLMASSSEAKYKEALSLKNECEALAEGR